LVPELSGLFQHAIAAREYIQEAGVNIFSGENE